MVAEVDLYWLVVLPVLRVRMGTTLMCKVVGKGTFSNSFICLRMMNSQLTACKGQNLPQKLELNVLQETDIRTHVHTHVQTHEYARMWAHTHTPCVWAHTHLQVKED